MAKKAAKTVPDLTRREIAHRKIILRALLANYGNVCAGCGRELTRGEIHVVRIIPRSRGGKMEFDNSQIMCEGCCIQKNIDLQS